jgi:hypothetical protein
MVEQGYAEDQTRPVQSVSQSHIVPGWRAVSIRVIVNDDDGRGTNQDRRTIDLTRVVDEGAQRALTDSLKSHEAVLVRQA